MSHNPGRFLLPLSAFAATARGYAVPPAPQGMAERGQSDLAGHAGRRFPVCTPVHGQRRCCTRRVRPSAGRHTSPCSGAVSLALLPAHPVWRSRAVLLRRGTLRRDSCPARTVRRIRAGCAGTGRQVADPVPAPHRSAAHSAAHAVAVVPGNGRQYFRSCPPASVRRARSVPAHATTSGRVAGGSGGRCRCLRTVYSTGLSRS